MKNVRKITMLILPLLLLLPGLSAAAIIKPALDIQDMTGDAGVSLTATSFDIDATAFSISTNAAPINIADQIFTLTSTGTYDGSSGSFSGSFTVDGGLLSGTFDALTVVNLGGTDAQFFADLIYTGGSLMGTLSGGRIEGIIAGTSVVASLGKIAVVPVPAAVWLFGSGLIGLAGIARRKA